LYVLDFRYDNEHASQIAWDGDFWVGGPTFALRIIVRVQNEVQILNG
jgi:hypothetical protein